MVIAQVSMLPERVGAAEQPHRLGGASDYLCARNVSVAYAGVGDAIVFAIERVNLAVDRGTFTCLLGPSGCGKTTLLNAVAGFLPISSDALMLHGESISRP